MEEVTMAPHQDRETTSTPAKYYAIPKGQKLLPPALPFPHTPSLPGIERTDLRRRRKVMNAKLRFAIRAALIAVFIIVGTVPARAAEKTTKGGETFSSMTNWVESDSQGNTIFTQLDILSGVREDQPTQFCQPCTTVRLSRDVVDPAGHTIFTDDSFFGRTFTPIPYFG